MATIVTNYGTINISNEVIASLAGRAAEQCYGIVGMSGKRAADGIAELLNRENYAKGVRVSSSGEEAQITLYVIVEYGTSINVVAESAIDIIRYNVEQDTGLRVTKVNIIVEGVRV